MLPIVLLMDLLKCTSLANLMRGRPQTEARPSRTGPSPPPGPAPILWPRGHQPSPVAREGRSSSDCPVGMARFPRGGSPHWKQAQPTPQPTSRRAAARSRRLSYIAQPRSLRVPASSPSTVPADSDQLGYQQSCDACDTAESGCRIHGALHRFGSGRTGRGPPRGLDMANLTNQRALFQQPIRAVGKRASVARGDAQLPYRGGRWPTHVESPRFPLRLRPMWWYAFRAGKPELLVRREGTA